VQSLTKFFSVVTCIVVLQQKQLTSQDVIYMQAEMYICNGTTQNSIYSIYMYRNVFQVVLQIIKTENSVKILKALLDISF